MNETTEIIEKSDLVILTEKRTNRIEHVLEKVKDLVEESKFYNLKDSIDISNSIYHSLKDKIKKTPICNNSTIYNLEIKIDNDKKDNWIDSIIDSIREAKLYIIDKILINTKKDLIKNFMNNNQDDVRYISAIKKLIFTKMSDMSDELENELFEIKKDLISGIEYNNKINKMEQVVK